LDPADITPRQEELMQEFIAIDFETANPKRVSACALGYVKVSDCRIVESNGHLIKPVGGHALFQTKIHGITEEHTRDKPEFGELFPEIRDIFEYPLVAHSLFDKQVLNALSDYFDLDLCFDYFDSSALAKKKLPNIKNCKLKTLVKHFGLPAFKHHDAMEDAIACANVFLKLCENEAEAAVQPNQSDAAEFKGLVSGILADDVVNYKEAYTLLYWLEDHLETAKQHRELYRKTKEILEDDHLDEIEEEEIRAALRQVASGL
jgi:DNA polymerase-3 subunit epsilon